MPIKLTICLPESIVSDCQADKIVLPLENKNLTVISGRAPTLQKLACGPLTLLNENNLPCDEYFIDGGYAQIENDSCRLAVKRCVHLSTLQNQTLPLSDTQDAFEKALAAYIKAFK